MRTSSIIVALLGGLGSLAACETSAESPVPVQPPSAVARLASQACTCTTSACLEPLKKQLEGIIAAQHSGANATKDNAEAKAKITQCEARLGK